MRQIDVPHGTAYVDAVLGKTQNNVTPLWVFLSSVQTAVHIAIAITVILLVNQPNSPDNFSTKLPHVQVVTNNRLSESEYRNLDIALCTKLMAVRWFDTRYMLGRRKLDVWWFAALFSTETA